MELLLLSRSAVAILRFMSLYRSHKRAYSSDEKDWLFGEVELARASVAVGCRSADVVGVLLSWGFSQTERACELNCISFF